MGVAIFVTFQKKIPKVNPWDMGGKLLAANLDKLDRVAMKHDRSPLSFFVSGSPEELDDFIGEKKGKWDVERERKFAKKMARKVPRAEQALWKTLEKELNKIDKTIGAMKKIRDLGPLPEQWFDPAAALPTVRFLQVYVREKLKSFGRNVNLLQADLAAVERFLKLAKRHKVLFHLSIDV